MQTAAGIGKVGQLNSIITGVRWSPDGSRLVSCRDDGTVRIWDGHQILAPGETAQPIHILTGHSNNVMQVNWSSDGSRLALAIRDVTVSIWDASIAYERESR